MGEHVSQYLGGALGLLPSALMLVCSMLPTCLQIGDLTEASIQNIAAGMILGAVGMEFFPVIKESTENGDIYAVTAGFIVALVVLLGIERLVAHLERVTSADPIKNETFASGTTSAATEDTPLMEEAESQGYDGMGVRFASKALSSEAHQRNIKERILEIKQYVDTVTSRCRLYLKSDPPRVAIADSEQMFENIDEALHMLSYKIDHTARLLQGSEYEPGTTSKESGLTRMRSRPTSQQIRPRFDDGQEVERVCATLESATMHILGHASSDVSPVELLELFDHLEELKGVVDSLHGHVESASRKWRRSQPFPETNHGDLVTIGLFLPVCIDSIVDGIVIGIAASTSFNAGVVMAIVNSMEMSFLAMAYSPR